MSGNNLYFGMVQVELCHIKKGTKRILKDTIAKYQDVTSYLIHVVCDHIDEILPLSANEQLRKMEELIHHTKANPAPQYKDFDTLFYKFPSYLRRAAIRSAIGHVQSHESRCDEYYEKRDFLVKKGFHYKKMEPAFSYHPNAWSTLYKGQSFNRDKKTVQIKAYVRNTWDWIEVSIPNRDYKNLMKAMSLGTLKNPNLVYKYHKFYLQFPVQYSSVKFPEVQLEDQTVLGVDLGFNNPAVCSVVDSTGTIHQRDFSPFKKDMDRISHILGLIKKEQRTSGKGQSLSSLYTKLSGLKENLVKQLSRWIVNLAMEYGVYGIVLEHLVGIQGKKSMKDKVHHWCVARIRDFIKGMAFREGIRLFIVNPNGTSMYAYDGSGKVDRDKHNHSLCTFSNGKRYNCDLSASYNIGARYFIRAYHKSIPVTEWSQFKAKVPGLSKRTEWTLSSLRNLSEVLVP